MNAQKLYNIFLKNKFREKSKILFWIQIQIQTLNPLDPKGLDLGLKVSDPMNLGLVLNPLKKDLDMSITKSNINPTHTHSYLHVEY